MLNWVWVGIMVLSVIAGAVTGKLEDVTNALLGGGRDAIILAVTLGGAMCLWGGIMRIADKGGLTNALARVMAPLMRLLFPGLDPHGPACRAMLMNMAANFLGLGNAATPFGIKAMGELDKANPNPGTASNHMVTFVALNTASIQLLPTTVATLRLQYGASSPMNILPAVWMTSLGSALVAVTLSRLLGTKEERPVKLAGGKSGSRDTVGGSGKQQCGRIGA